MIEVAAVQDESSHWYVIPLELKEEFYKLEIEALSGGDDNYHKLLQEFDEKFSKYRTGGDLNNIQLYAEI